jgi:hypothetical protein
MRICPKQAAKHRFVLTSRSCSCLIVLLWQLELATAFGLWTYSSSVYLYGLAEFSSISNQPIFSFMFVDTET